MKNLEVNRKVQNLAMMLFPSIYEYDGKEDYITISTNKYGDKLISILLKYDDYMIEDFILDDDPVAELSLSYKPNQSNLLLDLTFIFDFYFNQNHIISELDVYGVHHRKQIEIANALLERPIITAFIVNSNLNVLSTIRMNFNLEVYQSMLEGIVGVSINTLTCSICGEPSTSYVEIDEYICKRCNIDILTEKYK